MIQGWRQHLYAFLLRQVLGPYLDASSAQKLKDSIEFSFQEGTYVLKDIGLNATHLTERLQQQDDGDNGGLGLSIRKAQIQRLEIRLSLKENLREEQQESSYSSLAWRAMKLGTTDSSSMMPAVSLVAEIIIDGVELEVEPCKPRRSRPKKWPNTEERQSLSNKEGQNLASDKTQQQQQSSKSIIGSYVDAALSSLRLGLKVTNISIKLVSQKNPSPSSSLGDNGHHETWVAVKMSSVSFNDFETRSNETTTTSPPAAMDAVTIREKQKRVLSKLIEVYEITIQAGETAATSSSSIQDNRQTTTVALAEGMAQVYIRIMEHSNNRTSSPLDDVGSNNGRDDEQQQHQQPRKKQRRCLEQDFDIKMNQQLNFSVDASSLLRIQYVADAFATVSNHDYDDDGEDEDNISRPEPEYEDTTLFNMPTRLNQGEGGSEITTDEEDLMAISGIMRQYREAYHLAEKNQLQRGMLVPSHAYLDDGVILEEEDENMYDVFFDANDQSFYNAASVLMQSVHNIAGIDDEGGTTTNTSGDNNNEQHQERSSSGGDTVNTKIHLHMASACFKVVFRDPKHAPLSMHGPEEYVLLTMNDLICNASSTNSRESEVTLTVSHLQVEDAQLDKTKRSSTAGFLSVGGLPVFEGSIEIGSLLEFVEQTNPEDEYGNDLIVSQAPCIALHMRKSKPNAIQNVFDCDIELLPVELFYRQRTISNLTSFSSRLQEGKTQSRPTAAAASTRAASSSSDDKNDNEEEEENNLLTRFSCSCPYLTFSVPVPASSLDIQPIFDRCGQTVSGVPVRGSCLGIHIEQIEVSWREECEVVDGDTFPSEAGGGFSCRHFLVFASAPVGDIVSIDSQQMKRTDLFLATGRLEIDPITPISVQFKRNFPGVNGGNVGKESFPIVPSLSTFKARQEDEDEDMKIDKMLFSKLQDVDADSRKELRGSDPQLQMMAEAEKCDSVLSLSVPEIVVDLSKTEIETLDRILDSLSSNEDSEKGRERSTSSVDAPAHEESQSIGVAINFSQVSISIRESSDSNFQANDKLMSCLLAIDEVRMHLVHDGSDFKQFRFLAFEPCLYAAYHSREAPQIQRSSGDIRVRVNSFKERIAQYSKSMWSPIIYRSHMFNPISHATPSLVLDVLNIPPPARAWNRLAQKRIHLTLYHFTYRFDVDSDWIQRVQNLLPEKKSSDELTVPPGKGNSTRQTIQKQQSMTRVFVSVADLNLDYTSAPYFETASRSIVRIGDFRFSSNIMEPAVKVQSYSLSLGDFSYHICDVRHSYSHENSKLCRAQDILGRSIRPTKSFDAESGPMAETLLRDMKFVNVLSLDSLDAIIATVNGDGQAGNTRGPNRPKTTISLTLGLLSVQACKDSFNCFADTVGEIQAKLTALTDKDIEALRKESASCTSHGYADLLSLPDGAIPRKEDDFKKVVIGGKKSGCISPKQAAAEKSEKIPFLLDGYDWTTIDHDSRRQLHIPDGDEQIAMWYDDDDDGQSTDRNDPGKSRVSNFPGRIIHHHFPMHSLNDPLSDGDMGALTYGGEGAVLELKTRLLVHKLTVKVRFFDGYDWPEHLNPDQRAAAKAHKRFVVEPLPPEEKAGDNETTNDRKTKVKKGSSSASQSRKSQLMAGLLDSPEETSTTFASTPLPEERAAKLERQADILLYSRKPNLYFQVSANGVTVRIDSFEKSQTTRLVSILNVAISDLFIAETVSLSNPIKLLGEWVNDTQHPRDTRCGMLMMKMVTWNPLNKVTDDGEIENDDCEVTVELLPTRCIIDQRAITFIRAFFSNEEDADAEGRSKKWNEGLHVIPPPRFRAFRVKPWKLKVDYVPIELNVNAVRDGSLVELVNVCPIDGMVIMLSQAIVEDVVGFGSVFSGLLGSWIQEICATQLHKFLANARPFEPITDVGQGVTDLVVLPYEAFKNGDDIQRALNSGVKSLAETVVFQTLATTSRLTHYAATTLAGAVSDRVVSSNPLPSRPFAPPRGVSDVTGHAAESLARGFQAANYRVVIVPYREYSRIGVTGAASSIIKGIPVLLVAPLTGATEALSYTLLGARNALRPDLRKEEEATRSGFNNYDI